MSSYFHQDTVITSASSYSLAFQPHSRMPSEGRLMGPMYRRTKSRLPNRMSESTYSMDYSRHTRSNDICQSFKIDTIDNSNDGGFFDYFIAFLESVLNRKAVHAECLPMEVLR